MPWSLLVAVVGIAVAAGLACFETAAVVATQLPVNPAFCFYLPLQMIENLSEELELSGISKRQNESAVPKPEVPAPSQAEVEEFYSKLNKCNSKPVVLNLVPPYAQSYVLPSQIYPL